MSEDVGTWIELGRGYVASVSKRNRCIVLGPLPEQRGMRPLMAAGEVSRETGELTVEHGFLDTELLDELNAKLRKLKGDA